MCNILSQIQPMTGLKLKGCAVGLGHCGELGRARFFVKSAQVRGLSTPLTLLYNLCSEGGAVKELELWRIHKEHLNHVWPECQDAPNPLQLVDCLPRPDLCQHLRGASKHTYRALPCPGFVPVDFLHLLMSWSIPGRLCYAGTVQGGRLCPV